MIEKGVYGSENTDLLDQIKDSKYITISLGINDLINDIKYDKNNAKLTYNKELIEERINVFKHNYFNIVNGIKEVNAEAKIILVGNSFIYDDFIEGSLNNAIKDVASYNELIYIDISDMDKACFSTRVHR